MPETTLTTFVDFVSKAGTPKATVVRQWKHKPPYDPRSDYYRRFRDEIQDTYRAGDGMARLVQFIRELDNPRKVGNYEACLAGYRRWARRLQLDWCEPQNATWSSGGLNVRVNPELGFTIDGEQHLIKLYFKAEPLSRNRVELICHLMGEAYQGTQFGGFTKCVLAMRDGRLHSASADGLGPQLRAEAAYWMTLWPHV